MLAEDYLVQFLIGTDRKTGRATSSSRASGAGERSAERPDDDEHQRDEKRDPRNCDPDDHSSIATHAPLAPLLNRNASVGPPRMGCGSPSAGPARPKVAEEGRA